MLIILDDIGTVNLFMADALASFKFKTHLMIHENIF